jgi:hypothetical protein
MGLIKGFKQRNKGRVNFLSIEGGAAIANITTTATTGSLPTANGSVTIADTATPTVTELLEYCVELETKLEEVLTVLRSLGLVAAS